MGEDSSDHVSFLGVCALYRAAYPQGHTEADLSTPIFSLLPVPAETNLEENFDVTTDVVYAAYQAQEEFCISNAEAVDSMNAELQSGQLSAATVQLMEISMFEIAVFLETASATSSRRNLFFSNNYGSWDWLYSLPTTISATAIWDSAWHNAAGVTYDAANTVSDAIDEIGSWFGRRQLKDRLMNQELTASRRVLTDDGSVTIPTMHIVAACSNDIPSFVCSMSTSDLTEILSSRICGGSGNLAACDFSTNFALGYLSALGN